MNIPGWRSGSAVGCEHKRFFVIIYIITRDTRKYADRAEYLKAAVNKRKKLIRKQVVECKGGKCIMCKYNKCIKALEFHHLESDKKDFGISAKGHTRSWKKVKEELDKCLLLCLDCHREVHEGITQLPQVIEE